MFPLHFLNQEPWVLMYWKWNRWVLVNVFPVASYCLVKDALRGHLSQVIFPSTQSPNHISWPNPGLGDKTIRDSIMWLPSALAFVGLIQRKAVGGVKRVGKSDTMATLPSPAHQGKPWLHPITVVSLPSLILLGLLPKSFVFQGIWTLSHPHWFS